MLALNHRFAFIHVNKTGVTSIIEALADYEDAQALINDNDRATTYRDLLGLSLWTDLYTFAFLRNPYERMVSSYEYERQYLDRPDAERSGKLTFRDWILGPVADDPLNREWSDQLYMVCEEGDYSQVIVKDLFLYDDYAAGFARACSRIGIPRPDLMCYNKTKRSPWQDYYDADTVAMVRERYAHDLAWAARHHHGRWVQPKT